MIISRNLRPGKHKGWAVSEEREGNVGLMGR
jgi:hypothetical protein